MRHDISALTSLRGIAALSVASLHVSKDFGYTWNIAGHTFYVEFAYLWVDFFFILSGFIMSHVYGGDFVHDVRAGAVHQFLVKRIARIYPLHLLTLCFFWALALLKLSLGARTSGHIDPVLVPSHLFLLQGWGLHPKLYWNYPAWSISAEAAAYLAFPWLCLYITSSSRSRALLTGAGCLAGLMLLQALELNGSLRHATYDTGAIRCLFEFVLGMLLYRVHLALSLRRISALGADATAFGSVAALIGAMHLGAPEMAIVCLCALVILSASVNESAFARCFAAPPLLWLGSASYAVYMLQAPLQAIWGPISTRLPQGWTGQPVLGAVYFTIFMLALLCAAGLTHRFFEVPARKRVHQIALAWTADQRTGT
jgi:peptidoglycan/LPS O-acetylase OafA/YrhL